MYFSKVNSLSTAGQMVPYNTSVFLFIDFIIALIGQLPYDDNPNSICTYNNNGNFICIFECTIVNLATYRQFTNAA